MLLLKAFLLLYSVFSIIYNLPTYPPPPNPYCASATQSGTIITITAYLISRISIGSSQGYSVAKRGVLSNPFNGPYTN